MADDDGTQDRAADYEGEGGEQVVNNNGIRARAPGREREKIKKSSLCKKTFFSDTVCPLDFLLPSKHPILGFRFISLIFLAEQADRAYGSEICQRSFVISFVILYVCNIVHYW